MKTLFISASSADQVIRAFCATLLHSLWQGLIAAFIAGLVISFTRRSSSVTRYNLLVSVFFVFAIGVCFTFGEQYKMAVERTKVQAITDHETAVAPIWETTQIEALPANDSLVSGVIDSFVLYFDSHATLVVLVWLVIFSTRFLKLMAGIGYIQRIRHYKSANPSQEWKEITQQLAARLGLQGSVQLLESAIVKVPLVVGWLKPTIMVPLGLLANLSKEQVEAILLHELAHIRRKDYIINLFQTFVEAIFFFNPALLWISTLIRDERENCCDDIAVEITNNKEKYINALVSFQEYQLQADTVLSFGGREDHLLHRVRRIIYNENKKLNAMEKVIMVISIVAMTGLSLLSAESSSAQVTPPTSVTTTNLNDTTPTNITPPAMREGPIFTDEDIVNVSTNVVDNKDGNVVQILATTKQNTQYRIRKKDGRVIEFYVNGQQIPENKIADYTDVIGRIERVSEERWAKVKAEKDMQQQQRRRQLEERRLLAEQRTMEERNRHEEQERSRSIEEKFKRDHAKELEVAKQNLRRAEEEFNKKQKEYEQSKEKEEMLQRNERKKQKQLFKEVKPVKPIELKEADIKIKQDMKMQMDFNQKMQLKQKITEQRLIISKEAQKVRDERLLEGQKTRDGRFSKWTRPASVSKGYKATGNSINTNVMLLQVIDALLEKGLVKDKNNIAFTLNNEKLTVNGVPQSPTIHSEFREQFIRNPQDYYDYSSVGGTTKSTIIVH